jgi:catalase
VDADLAERVANGLGLDVPAPMPPAKEPVDLAPSDALSILKQVAPANGRRLGILVTDGADGSIIRGLIKAAEAVGASVKIIAPKIGGVTLKGGKKLAADEKIDGAPSVLFDAVALVLSEDGAKMLLGEKAALDFVSDAYAHCKAIGHTDAAKALVEKAGARRDAFFFDLPAGAGSLASKLSMRQWSRETKVKLPV